MALAATVFRTVVPLVSSAGTPLRHAEHLTLLGSCFSDGVGSRLSDAGHSTLVNPLGTIFNPVSLQRAVALFAGDAPIVRSDLEFCERQQLFYSFDAGTALAHEDCETCLNAHNEAIRAGRASLETSAALFLTLGTAWAYVRSSSGAVVANCHRQPQNEFERRVTRRLN